MRKKLIIGSIYLYMVLMALYYLMSPTCFFDIPKDVIQWSRYNYIITDICFLLFGICIYISNLEYYVRTTIIGFFFYQIIICIYDIFLLFISYNEVINYCNKNSLSYILYGIILCIFSFHMFYFVFKKLIK